MLILALGFEHARCMQVLGKKRYVTTDTSKSRHPHAQGACVAVGPVCQLYPGQLAVY
jgi:hypothetical protein